MGGARTPKWVLAALLCAIVALCCVSVPALAVSEGNEGDSLVVGVPTDRCPVFYQDEASGKPIGIGVDLMRAVAEEAGYNATFEAVKEATLKDALDSDKYDVVMPFGSAIASSSGRATIVSDNLMQMPFTLVTEGDRELPPLNELRVGMLRSLSAGAETVQELFPGTEISMYETMADSVDALRAGKVDVLLHNSYVWSYVLQKPAYSDLSVQPSTMFSMDFRVGALDTPDGRAIVERLNSGIAAIPDTLRQAIALDYTSRRLYHKDLSDYLYEIGLPLVLGVLLVIAIIVIIMMRHHAYRLEQEEKMRKLIDYDPLTGALSLNGFRKRVEELLRAHPDTPYFLSYNNIKNFKFINDSLGMETGDELLRFWVEKSLSVMSDEEAIGRLEGDRIAVLRRLGGEEQMIRDRDEVLEPLWNYLVDRDRGKRVQTSTGMYVLTPDDYQHIDVDHMLDCARVAEKRGRNSHTDNYVFYNSAQWERGKLAADVVGHLSKGIQTEEFQVWYQPQVNYETGEIIGAEALCRWNHAKLGWLLPVQFIPMLEDSGLIIELDSFVWDRVCQDLHRWNERGVRRSVSVNLSRGDIWKEPDVPTHFQDLIRKYDLGVDQLRIEITETAFAEDPAMLIQTTVKLQELGFQVEMDDFGSGLSSLHMLKEVPVDRIKLDLHFLTETGDQEKGRIILSHIIQMAHSLDIKLITEGVEEADQAQFLQSRGCPEMQGYYFYEPMSVGDFEKLGEQAEAFPWSD